MRIASLALHLAFAIGGESRATQLPALATPAVADTIGVLQAVVQQMRLDRAASDSARKTRCAEGDRSLCPAPYPRQPLWYIPPDSAGPAGHLARIDSVPARLDARLPSCPWPANAPAESGYQARVDLQFERDDQATVVVRLTCRNPSGYLHDIYKLERTYDVIRRRSSWKAQLTLTRVT